MPGAACGRFNAVSRPRRPESGNRVVLSRSGSSNRRRHLESADRSRCEGLLRGLRLGDRTVFYGIHDAEAPRDAALRSGERFKIVDRVPTNPRFPNIHSRRLCAFRFPFLQQLASFLSVRGALPSCVCVSSGPLHCCFGLPQAPRSGLLRRWDQARRLDRPKRFSRPAPTEHNSRAQSPDCAESSATE